MSDYLESLNQISQEFKSGVKRPSSDSLTQIHVLAEKQYAPSISLFEEMLSDTRDSWVKVGINGLLDFEKLDSTVLDRVRSILVESSNPYVKMTAADFLGLRSKWPDAALRKCLMNEEDRDVRISATRAILELAKVNSRAVSLEIERMKAEEIEPEFAEIERITQADADGLYKDLT
jgi:ribulose bisphosphate carboxylase small subunit